MACFAADLAENYVPEPNEEVVDSIFKQYERIIIESIITSFGMDFLIKDQVGGDVDTINNVRKMGKEEGVSYKNKENKLAYENRGIYNQAEYHGDTVYRTTVRNAKKQFNEEGKWLKDSYTGEKIAPTKNVESGKQAQLDHVIAAKEIHNDPGRVLAGIKGTDLANSPENLRFTNASLNNNMKDKSIPEYIKWCEENPDQVNWNGKKGEPLPDDVKNRLMKEYENSRKSYEKKINQAYYTSNRFMKDVTKAAGRAGTVMGIRQALGFVFAEIWFSVKEVFHSVSGRLDLKQFFENLGQGIKRGVENAKRKYKEIFSKLKEGFVSGALASITTTLCNIFFTTAKNVARIIRQTWASIVQAGKILLFNPDELLLGDRLKAAATVLATGAGVVVGTLISEMINQSPIGSIPIVGGIIETFCGSLVTGILSCTLIYYLDRSEEVQKIIHFLNNFPSIDKFVENFRAQADLFEKYGAELEKIDLEQFKKETALFNDFANHIESIIDESELTQILLVQYEKMGLSLPWKGDFDTFMGNKSNHLVFE